MGALLLSSFFLLISMVVALGVMATGLSYTAVYGFGPGFFPLWVCAAMGVLSLLLVLQHRHVRTARPIDLTTLKQVAAPVGCLMLATVTIEVLGFLLVSFLATTLLLLLGGKKRIRTAVGVGAGFSLFVYVLFVRLLGVSLGRGMLGI